MALWALCSLYASSGFSWIYAPRYVLKYGCSGYHDAAMSYIHIY